MSQPQNFARRPQTMFNDYRYPMPASAAPMEGAKFPARWTWEFTLGGNVAFKVNDGIWGKDDRNAKSKEVELGNMDRNSLLNLMEEACNNPSFTKAQYHVKKVTFGAGNRLNDHPSTLAVFTVIRDQDGRISVGYSKGTYKVKFEFKAPFDSIIMVAKDGEVREDVGFMSRMYCKAFINYSRKFLDQPEWDAYKPKEPKGQGGNNNRGNGGGNGSWGGGNSNGGGQRSGGDSWGGNNNNSGGGQQRQQASVPDFDDNIDF